MRFSAQKIAQFNRLLHQLVLLTLLQHHFGIQLPCCFGQTLCAELEIHNQKWVAGPSVRQLGNAEHSADLQQCLQRCCARPDCSAISFSGFLLVTDSDNNSTDSSHLPSSSSSSSSSAAASNCALFHCSASPGGDIADTAAGDCDLTDGGTDAADQGLLSVRLRRKQDDHLLLLTKPADNNMFSASSTTTTASSPPATILSGSSTDLGHHGQQQQQKHNWTVNKTNSSDNNEANPADAETDQQRQILSLGHDNDGEDGGGIGTSWSAEENAEHHRPSSSSEQIARMRSTILVTSPAATTPAARNKQRAKSLLDLNTWDERFPLRAEATPVWAIGLAIVITVICLGLLASLLCAFLCYRRHKLRMRTLEFSGGPKKMPTLHAFNPS